MYLQAQSFIILAWYFGYPCLLFLDGKRQGRERQGQIFNKVLPSFLQLLGWALLALSLPVPIEHKRFQKRKEKGKRNNMCKIVSFLTLTVACKNKAENILGSLLLLYDHQELVDNYRIPVYVIVVALVK